MDRVPTPTMTIKVTGHQWYWSYELSRPGNCRLRQQHHRRQGSEAGAAAAARRRQPAGGAGRHERPGAGHRHRRDPQLVRAVVRGPGIRGDRPAQRSLVQRRAGQAPITASATRSAASTTPSCRSRSVAVSKDDFAAMAGRRPRRSSRDDQAGRQTPVRRRRPTPARRRQLTAPGRSTDSDRGRRWRTSADAPRRP